MMDIKIRDRQLVWQKPELIILVRSRPEEAVLTNCKSGTLIFAGQGDHDSYAYCVSGMECSICNVTAAS